MGGWKHHYHDCGDGFTVVCICQNVQFIVCQLYLNKDVKEGREEGREGGKERQRKKERRERKEGRKEGKGEREKKGKGKEKTQKTYEPGNHE